MKFAWLNGKTSVLHITLDFIFFLCKLISILMTIIITEYRLVPTDYKNCICSFHIIQSISRHKMIYWCNLCRNKQTLISKFDITAEGWNAFFVWCEVPFFAPHGKSAPLQVNQMNTRAAFFIQLIHLCSAMENLENVSFSIENTIKINWSKLEFN